MVTKPGNTGNGAIDFDQSWSAYEGGSEEVELQRNILVGTGKDLELEDELVIDFNGKTLRTTGGNITGNGIAVALNEAVPQKSAIRLEWDAHSSNPGYYLVHWGTSSGNYYWDEAVSSSTTSKVISLTNGSQYYFKGVP